jgi:hypothetical protein
MTHSLLITISALAVVSACLPPEPDAPDPEHPAALVGRLRFHDRVVDLTLDAFGSAPDAVPVSSYAEIMADSVPAERSTPDAMREPRHQTLRELSVESDGHDVQRRPGRSQ